MSSITRTDVTAVIFYNKLILAGIGSTLNVFDKQSTKLQQRLQVLHGQKIYGIVPSKFKSEIIVFGGKQFTVLSVDENEVLIKKFEAVVCDDWLHSALWVYGDVIAVLTAHNVVQKWNTTTLELISQHASKDNSILYSGLLVPLKDDILVMAGTVFSEVIIHRCSDDKQVHNLKEHKGVIFSISCKPEKNIIVTTSDDRSVCIWGPETIPPHSHDTINYWKNISIVCKHKVYGHLARVMRSCISNRLIISVGEDSAICYWDYEGKLKKKIVTHQNGCIWSVDADEHHLVTGGGDCGVIIHPLTAAIDYSQNDIIDIGVATPKRVEFTARRNLVVTDENNLIYYNFSNKNKCVYELKYESTYRMLSLSSCRQLVAVADMTGKLGIFVENCKDDAVIIKLIDIKLDIGKVLSMHWAGNRHLVFCTDNGHISVFASSDTIVEEYAHFILPPCKEALLTAVAVDFTKNYFVVGDRCGNIHIFVKGQVNPVKSFSKVHGRYGPRTLLFTDKSITSTGRDHSVKYFTSFNGSFKFMRSKDFPFAWVEKFLDKDQNLVCGFQERVFVVYNIKNNSKVLEIPCGGGHRSFDAIRYIDKVNDGFDEIIKLVYLKDSDINVATFELSKIVSKNVINGSHAKEINCLKSHKVKVNDDIIYITGGEDTTLRISSVDAAMNFQDEFCFRHLSSVRTLSIYFIDQYTFLLVSAGGRAQICVKKVKIIKEKSEFSIVCEELIDYLVKGTDKERKGNQPWKNCYVDFDPEMRIMDLDIHKFNQKFVIFAGCSDAYLRVFSFGATENKLEILKAKKYHSTCILKTKCIQMYDKNILVTCTTRGDVTFWDITNIFDTDLTPFFSTKTNKSGINSIIFTTIANNKFLIGTGGDDNAIHLVLLEIPDQNNLGSMKVLNTWNSSNFHSSQITGLCSVDSYLISASIDQRITLLQWKIIGEEIECNFVNQVYTDVADVQGMELLEVSSDTLTVCVFGKGMEVLAVSKN
ncbi:unnamed protein product [Arctia plantaginis]|uniref:tRNA (34-2'-O)-methyltransferase regulator WDR6 n=1 Tax=Arctia plantaginis TaxID=874455 RepID=A0A8S1B411_ARCPL|nr:unnamed protein product [Arctia plantaginis]